MRITNFGWVKRKKRDVKAKKVKENDCLFFLIRDYSYYMV